MKLATQLLAAYAVGSAVAEVYFKEQFNDDVSWRNDPDRSSRMTWKSGSLGHWPDEADTSDIHEYPRK